MPRIEVMDDVDVMDSTGNNRALTRLDKKEGSAVTDMMRFNGKPVAVRSENILSSVKASNGSRFSGDGTSTIIFDIPAMSGGYYLDPATTRMTFNLSFTDANQTASAFTNGSVYLDRGPGSLFTRFQLYDASGHLLEDIQDYNVLYGMLHLATSDAPTANTRGQFFKECRYGGKQGVSSATAANNRLADLYGNFNTTTVAQLQQGTGAGANQGNIITGVTQAQTITNTPANYQLGPINGVYNLQYPDGTMGGRVLQMGSALSALQGYDAGDVTNGIWPLSNDGCVMTTTAATMSLSHTFISSIFGGGFNKYYPLSAMNGFRMVLTLATPNTAFQIENGSTATVSGTTNAANITLRYSLSDPTMYCSMVRVDPSVDRGLLVNMRGTDGRIRIPTTSWRQYKQTIYAGDTVKNLIIPFSVSSLKAIFFGFVPATLDGSISGSSMFTRNLSSYQLFVGSVPIPVVPVQVTPPYNESYAELLRSFHVRLNDQNWPTLIQYNSYLRDYYADNGKASLSSFAAQSDAFFGVELESFNQKNNAIECGANVLNNNIELRMNFSATSANNYNLIVYGYHDVFVVIDPNTGITSLEF